MKRGGKLPTLLLLIFALWWFREVHYLVKEGDVWRFLGNAGKVPAAAPFASAPHHPLF